MAVIRWSKRTRAARGGKPPLLFIGGVCLFISVIFCAIGGTLWLTERRYSERGVRTPAIVTGKTMRPATADTSTVYEVTYEFTAAEAGRHTQTEAVDVHVWEAAERGAPLEVEYVSGDPSSARVPPSSTEEATVALIMLGFGLLVGAVGLGMIGAALRTRRTARERAGPEPGADGGAAVELQAARGSLRTGSTWQIARSSFGFLFGGIFLLCGLPFLIVGLSLFYADWRFARDAHSTEGLVLTKDIRYSSSSGSGSSRRSSTRHYEVTYRFTEGGATHEGEDELPRAEWLRLRERAPVEVFYRPGRPSSNRLIRGGDWVLKTVFTLLGGIFCGIGGYVFFRSLAGARLKSRLLEHGQRTDGTVVALAPRNVRINDVRQWRLRYSYQDYQGRRHEGTFDLPESEASEWAVGETGRVLYDRSDPATAVWVGRGD